MEAHLIRMRTVKTELIHMGVQWVVQIVGNVEQALDDAFLPPAEVALNFISDVESKALRLEIAHGNGHRTDSPRARVRDWPRQQGEELHVQKRIFRMQVDDN